MIFGLSLIVPSLGRKEEKRSEGKRRRKERRENKRREEERKEKNEGEKSVKSELWDLMKKGREGMGRKK